MTHSHHRTEQKKRLIETIEQQRKALSEVSQTYLEVTAPYDRFWLALRPFRPLITVTLTLFSIYRLQKTPTLEVKERRKAQWLAVGKMVALLRKNH